MLDPMSNTSFSRSHDQNGNNVASSSTLPSSSLSIAFLRRSIRLVHCLQKERGASCALSAASASFVISSAAASAATSHTTTAGCSHHSSLDEDGEAEQRQEDIRNKMSDALSCARTGTDDALFLFLQEASKANTVLTVAKQKTTMMTEISAEERYPAAETALSGGGEYVAFGKNVQDEMIVENAAPSIIMSDAENDDIPDVRKALRSIRRLVVINNDHIDGSSEQQHQNIVTTSPSLESKNDETGTNINSPTKTTKNDDNNHHDHYGADFHKILVLFNALISKVIQTCVLRTIRYEQHELKETVDTSSSVSDHPTSQQKLETALSLLSLLLCFIKLKESTGIERAVLSSLMAMGPSYSISSTTWPNSPSFHKSTGVTTTSTTTATTSPAEAEAATAATTTPADQQHQQQEQSKIINDLVLEVENQRNTLRELKSLTRRRRLVDSSYLVASSETSTGPVGTTSPTVPAPPLCCRQQIGTSRRRTTTGLPGKKEKMDENHKSSLALVEQGVELSPQMSNLQNKIRLNFDLVGFQKAMRMEEFWGLITLYIDKLHSLELLIIDELEGLLLRKKVRCVWFDGDVHSRTMTPTAVRSEVGQYELGPGKEKKTTILSPAEKVGDNLLSDILNRITGAKGPVSRSEAVQKLRTLPPEKVKESLISCLSVSSKSPDAGFLTSEPTKREQDKEKFVEHTSPVAFVAEDTPPAAPKEWEIDLYQIEFQKRIGRGSAGTTYLAKWGGQDVAVKVAAASEMGLEGWNTEVQALQRLHHPNIIRLLGAACNSSPLTYCLVLEYCDAGDLSSALERRTPRNFFFHVAGSIATGMAYLHSRKVMHRDIKPGNVLLHGDVPRGKFSVKLTDFGVAKSIQEATDENKTAETGTYRYMAPEVVRHEPYSYMADVYSFALLSWQIITREDPFANQSQIEAAGMVALENARPPFPAGTPEEIVSLIKMCWDRDASRRWKFDKISSVLTQLNKALSLDDKEWLESPFGHRVYKVQQTGSQIKTTQANGQRAPPVRSMSWQNLTGPEARSNKVESRKSLLNLFSKKKKK